MELPKITTNKDLVKKGRPTVSPSWPQGEFTFRSLVSSNQGTLCQSSLRNKVKTALDDGNLKKTRSEKGSFGRPQDVYLVTTPLQINVEQLDTVYNRCEQTQQESAGESMPLS